ncbi:hypothetical protein KS4_05790 [Poriferisphaera corsica]|uniref:Coenzyme Q-binding protein COQ10 START domain-containing protein n=1 Tax=Poriferisphaera corsica TaxID=2528020 RepID=A0A517YQN8_9BACT|nr:hypothetical protein [Poriferisphaera corsica]QDU32547.1 hypothetical protein KS4_05790 [Poriferisphaera corsica]
MPIHDEQLKGPYKLWRHEHWFEDSPQGCICHDRVTYYPPGGLLAPLINHLFIQNDLIKIFNYRTKIINKIFK